jgi:hypothetical protein
VLLGKAHLRPHSLGGLWEKLFLAVELAWLLLASIWVARGGNADAPRENPAASGTVPPM